METSIKYFAEDFIKNIIELQDKFFMDPKQLPAYVYGVSDELQKLGLLMIKESLESIDKALCKSGRRKDMYYIERHDNKQLVTSLGKVDFSKTLFTDKETQQEMQYLIDDIIGLSKHQRLTDDAVAKVLEEATDTSYRRGGASLVGEGSISKAAVKKLVHGLKYPEDNFIVPQFKKVVEYLYIDADEDHFSLQFQEEKGDLQRNANGRKLNGAMNKIIYVYEGIEPEAPKSKRNRLVGKHFYCRSGDMDNRKLWDEVYRYIDCTYDMKSIKKIYLNSDGGAWIKAGLKRLADVTFVLDEYHISQSLGRMTGHMKDSQEDALTELKDAIRNGTRNEFIEVAERVISLAPGDSEMEKSLTEMNYILSNWGAAKLRLRHRAGVCGCSAEGHVYHVLSSRMSTLAMGWSRKGATQMARLREWKYNGRDFLELARYQHAHEFPMAAGAEEICTSVCEMLRSEMAGRTDAQRMIGKYVDAITHTWSIEIRKRERFYSNHWISGM